MIYELVIVDETEGLTRSATFSHWLFALASLNQLFAHPEWDPLRHGMFRVSCSYVPGDKSVLTVTRSATPELRKLRHNQAHCERSHQK